MTRCMESVKRAVMPYEQRIRNYNEEKKVALLLATNADEAQRIIRILAKRWRV